MIGQLRAFFAAVANVVEAYENAVAYHENPKSETQDAHIFVEKTQELVTLCESYWRDWTT